jgi:cellulose biosynthesis protein BcsQ
MIRGVIYSESGGTYKTVTSANLAVALRRMDLDVLVLDLDPQTGNLTSLFDVGEHRDDEDADNLVRHILERPKGDFEDLIETTDEGVDVLPSHGMFGDFTSNLEQKITYEAQMERIDRDEYPRYELLYDLLWERERIQDDYDAVLVDPNARAEDLLYNAIYALRTLVAPVKPAGKGSLSLDGLEELVGNMQADLGIEVGLSCVVPQGVGQTNAHKRYCEKFESSDEYATPVTIDDRESMMDAMWDAKGSAFKVIEERWKTPRDGGDGAAVPGERGVHDRELDTLADLWTLAGFVATDTFDEAIDPELTLDIQGEASRTITYDPARELEVTN